MERLRLNNNQGMSLVEVIVAIGIFSIITTTGVGVFITSSKLTTVAEQKQAALYYARDGLEAVRSIKSDDFARLTNGTHGLALVDNAWELQDSSDARDGYTREIYISDAGTEIKEITSKVAWEGIFGDSELSLTTQLTDWAKVMRNAASYLSVEIGSAYIPAKKPKDLQGITLENIGASDIFIDTITVSWTPDVKRKMNAIIIGGITVWSNSGPGSPPGTQAPGVVIDIVDVVLPAGGGTILIDKFDFNGHMKDNVFDITFTMSDGSEAVFSNVVPPII